MFIVLKLSNKSFQQTFSLEDSISPSPFIDPWHSTWIIGHLLLLLTSVSIVASAAKNSSLLLIEMYW